MKKTISFCFIIPALIIIFSGCGSENETEFDKLYNQIVSAPAGRTVTITGSYYLCTSQIILDRENANVTIQAADGVTPVLDFSGFGATGDSGAGIYIKGSYYTIKGITIKNAPTKGILIKSKMSSSNTASHNTIENCVLCNNGDSGVSITTSDSTNDGSRSSYNLVKNCDSYLNADLSGSTGPGGNADGYSCKLYPGEGNKFYGCRSWRNSDDGFDFITTSYTITVENCWTWHNGDPDDFGYTGSSWGGNGQGFKGGGGGTTVSHIFKNCVAFDIRYGKSGTKKGFDSNNNLGGNIYYNCVAFNCQYGYSYGKGSYGAPTDPVFKNCVSFSNTTNYNFDGALSVDAQNNDWTLGLTTTSADFKSIDVNLALAARQTDGSLPSNDFCKLISSSPLIDKGIDVGTAYLGTAPDLGAFELK